MRTDWKDSAFTFYTNAFAKLDPSETAVRCNLPFDAAHNVFNLLFMGVEYRLRHPDFSIMADADTELSLSEQILVLRYLCAGHYKTYAGISLSYREVPWGEVYYKNFEGRCIERFARTFGAKSEVFINIMENTPTLNAQKIAENHPAYRFMFFSNLYMSLHLWPRDDEFPASAQILFDDNVPSAFSAEDLAVACEAVIGRLKTAIPPGV